MNKDLVSGVALIIIAGLYYQASGAILDSALSDEVGAVGLPRALAATLAVLGLLLAVRSLIARSSAERETAPAAGDDGDAPLPRALAFLAFGVAYVVLLPYIGYIASVALLIAAVALFEGAPRRWTVPAAAIFGALLYWAVFVRLLGVKQPVGAIFGKFLS